MLNGITQLDSDAGFLTQGVHSCKRRDKQQQGSGGAQSSQEPTTMLDVS